MRRRALLLGALAATAWPGRADAEAWPARPVRIIVPYPAGGPVDVLSRLVAQRLGEVMGKPFVVENRGGASTAIGTEAAAKSAPDGYTLMMGTVSSHAMSPALNKVPYDPVKDFAPVGLVASMPFLLVVHPGVPARSLGELLALARAQPGKLTYASAGVGTSNHFAGELFKSMAGVEITHIPYRGMAPGEADVIAGQVSMIFDTTITAMPKIASGDLRALAVTTERRVPFMPDLPTIAEAGMAGYAVETWYGIFAPAGTPPAIVTALNDELVRMMPTRAMIEKLTPLGAAPLTSTPEQLGSYVQAELEKWRGVVRQARISPE